MSDSPSVTDKYADWKSDGNTGYDQTLTSPGWWLWRYAGNPDARSLPTRKTVLVSLGTVAIAIAVILLGTETRTMTDDFRAKLTNAEDGPDAVNDVYRRIMAIAASRTEKGLDNPGEVSIIVNPQTGKLRVMNKEIETEGK